MNPNVHLPVVGKGGARQVGYHGQPFLKPPVWTWEVPLYFWVGGAAGMAALLALTSLVGNASLEVARAGLWLAAIGALVSPVLLILDLGRPKRFLHMLRVLKPRSPMSVGVWTLVLFGNASGAALILFEASPLLVNDLELPKELISGLLYLAMLLSGLSGALLATYTGVLLGATAVPAWFSHKKLLPLHFGVASLGTAAALLEMFGPDAAAFGLVGLAASIVETVLFALLETVRQGARDRALREGASGRRLRIAGLLMGPLPLMARMLGAPWLAAGSFALGALVSRFAWVAAGRASALDPEAAHASRA
jgi:Polysulphide reductase, NrfD